MILRAVKLPPGRFISIVMINNNTNKSIFLNSLFLQKHASKYQKYQHLISDIEDQLVNIIPFEIGAHTGYIYLENKESCKNLHKFCKNNIKLRKCKQNNLALTVLSSYLISNSRNHGWGDMDPILPPFTNQ